MSDIPDGTSNTYLMGEKFCDPDHYADGRTAWDDQGWDTGWDWDNVRWCNNNESYRPRQDTPGGNTGYAFGSAHGNGCHMAFCDGSVTMINYSINLEVHRRLGSRNDGETIDAKSY